MKIVATEIGKPEENPEREIIPLYDPVPREKPLTPPDPVPIKPIEVPVKVPA